MPSSTSCGHSDVRMSVWHMCNAYNRTRAKQDLAIDTPDKLPEYVSSLAAGTATYEQRIRDAWDALKANPTPENIQAFADLMELYSSELWPEILREVLGIDELTQEQEDFLEEALGEHHGYIKGSLLPDVKKAVDADTADSMDYRVIFLYAGALWRFGSLAYVMFDGDKLRGLDERFLFVGPNDESTCTGHRGCAQHVGKVYAVAEILKDMIIPGYLKCITNCRHFLMPWKWEWPVTWPDPPWPESLLSKKKHLPGRHPQSRHAGARSGAARAAAEDFERRYAEPSDLQIVEGGRMIAADGTVLWEDMKGEKTSLAVPGLARIEGRGEGGVFTHYHPPLVIDEEKGEFGSVELGARSMPPSASDYEFAVQNDLDEMRAVGWTAGLPVRYTMKRPARGWADPHEVLGEAQYAMERLKNARTMSPYESPSDYTGEIMHQAWKVVAKKYKIGYEMEYI